LAELLLRRLEAAAGRAGVSTLAEAMEKEPAAEPSGTEQQPGSQAASSQIFAG
jgi:hypothetical protein